MQRIFVPWPRVCLNARLRMNVEDLGTKMMLYYIILLYGAYVSNVKLICPRVRFE